MSSPRPKIPRRPVHGVLLLDKPTGLSSNHALQAAKRLLCAEKAGHTGTLDPLASGLLPLCFGEATKFSQTLLDADKAYGATLKLGIRTDTFDAEGVAIEQKPVSVTREQLLAVLDEFRGEIDQLPPMHSALKRDGKPLYEYARAGITLERETRRVTIAAITLFEFAGDVARIAVDCSKGTYIRTLADDIGARLGCGAHLAGLRRTRIGPFGLSGAITLDQLEATPAEERESMLAPVDALLQTMPMMNISEREVPLLLHGQRLPTDSADGRFRLYGPQGFLGVGSVENHVLHPARLLKSS